MAKVFMGKRKKTKIFTEHELKRVSELAPFLSLDNLAAHFSLTLDELNTCICEQPEISMAHKRGISDSVRSMWNVIYKRGLGGDFSCAKYWLDKIGGWERQHDFDIIEPMQVNVSFDDTMQNKKKGSQKDH